MNTTAIVLTILVFGLVGAVAFVAFASALSEVNADADKRPKCTTAAPGTCGDEARAGIRPPA